MEGLPVVQMILHFKSHSLKASAVHSIDFCSYNKSRGRAIVNLSGNVFADVRALRPLLLSNVYPAMFTQVCESV